jgi:hypothetical protein
MKMTTGCIQQVAKQFRSAFNQALRPAGRMAERAVRPITPRLQQRLNPQPQGIFYIKTKKRRLQKSPLQL